jgi:hypothetical protein
LSALASVKAPGSWPKSSLSSRVSGIAAQLIATNGSAARVLAAWRPRAKSSFPVPVSPTSKTVTLRLVATWVARARTSRIAALSPMT